MALYPFAVAHCFGRWLAAQAAADVLRCAADMNSSRAVIQRRCVVTVAMRTFLHLLSLTTEQLPGAQPGVPCTAWRSLHDWLNQLSKDLPMHIAICMPTSLF
jgi:hypothetical protein